MDSLPYEVLRPIFSSLTVDDWMQCIQVSKSWQSIVPSAVAELFTHLRIDHQTRRYIAGVRYFPSLYALTLAEKVSLSEVPVSQITDITCLKLVGGFPGAMTEAFGEHRPHVTSVRCDMFFEGDLRPMYNVLEAFPNLRHYDFRLLYSSVLDVSNALPDFQRRCHNQLLVLTISIQLVKLKLDELLSYLPNLRMLRFGRGILDRTDYISCKNLLSHCPKATHIWMGSEGKNGRTIRSFQERWDHDMKILLDTNNRKDDIEQRNQADGIRFAVFPRLEDGIDTVSSALEMLLVANIGPDECLGSERLKVVYTETIHPRALVHILKHSPNLTELCTASISEPDGIDILACPTTLDAVKSLSKLRSIKLPDTLPFDTAAKFLGVPAMYANLVELSIQESYCYVNDILRRQNINNVTATTFDFLLEFKNLRKLELYFVKEYLVMIPYLPALTELSLVNVHGLDVNTTAIIGKYETVRLRNCYHADYSAMIDIINVSSKLRLLAVEFSSSYGEPKNLEMTLAKHTNRNVTVIVDMNPAYDTFHGPVHSGITADRIDWDALNNGEFP
ncbi:hypothetical protein BX666DRAFT_1878802 [Dichotomocladium elegans]|nr:hypothetical protein BX666DRAFT_1878802 [Dichotomocladium elegans]